MVEYKVGDTAHLNHRIRVKAQKDDTITSMSIDTDSAVQIIAAKKSTDAVAIKTTGGAVYDILYECYKIDSVPQKDFYSKSQWDSISRMLEKLRSV